MGPARQTSAAASELAAQDGWTGGQARGRGSSSRRLRPPEAVGVSRLRVCLCALALARASPPSHPRLCLAHLESHSCFGGSRGSALAPSRGPPPHTQHQGLGLHLQSGGDTRRGRGARCTRAAWTDIGSYGETRSPNVAICPEAQSGHTCSPRWTPRMPNRQTRTHRYSAASSAATRARTPARTHTLTRSHARTPRVPATPRNFLPPAPQCPQLPFRLKLFPRWRQGSAERLDPPGLPGLGRPAPGASWLPSLPSAPLTW